MLQITEENKKEYVITLKEITDLIEVEHGKAMKKVEKLAKEPSFGTLAKTESVYNNKGQTIETFNLTKKQAIAVGAKLNNVLLMKVIDKVESLENKKPLALPTTKELALMVVQVEEEKELLKLENDKKSKVLDNVMHNANTYTATQIAKDFGISASLFNRILVEAKVQYKQNETYVLNSKYQSFKLTEIKEVIVGEKKVTHSTMRWTLIGKNWLVNNWDNALRRVDKETLAKYTEAITSQLPTIPKKHKKKTNE